MSVFSKKALVRSLIAAGLAAAAWSGSAQASTFTSMFTQSNTYPSSMSQDWGTLSATCTGTSCSVTLTPTGATFFGNEFLGFNLASGTSNLTLSSTLTADGATYSTGSFNLDGFGTFTSLISLSDGPGTGFSSTVSLFTLDYSGSAGDLFTLNDKGYDAAGHVLFGGTSCTGFVGEGTGTNDGNAQNCGTYTPPPPPPGVPEPSGLLLLGAGTLAAGWRVRRRAV
jgi:hypothetical protein